MRRMVVVELCSLLVAHAVVSLIVVVVIYNADISSETLHDARVMVVLPLPVPPAMPITIMLPSVQPLLPYMFLFHNTTSAQAA